MEQGWQEASNGDLFYYFDNELVATVVKEDNMLFVYDIRNSCKELIGIHRFVDNVKMFTERYFKNERKYIDDESRT